MMKMVNNETGNKLIKLGILTAAVGLGMKYVFPIALPFLIALALARFLYPLARYLENTVRIPRPRRGCWRTESFFWRSEASRQA